VAVAGDTTAGEERHHLRAPVRRLTHSPAVGAHRRPLLRVRTPAARITSVLTDHNNNNNNNNNITYSIGSTATKPGAAAQKTAQNKMDK